jgi:hypothetical protein
MGSPVQIPVGMFISCYRPDETMLIIFSAVPEDQRGMAADPRIFVL